MISLRNELTRCAKCGACRAVCPVFQTLQDETMVSRGRITLLEALAKPSSVLYPNTRTPVNLKITNRLRTILDCCLMCLRCREKCPSGVKTDLVFQAGRARFNLSRARALPLLFVFRFILPIRLLYNIALKLIYLFQKIFKNSPQGPAASRHLPFSLTHLGRLPQLASRSALEMSRHNRIFSIRQPRIAFFVGCLINYVYPEILKSISLVLEQADVELVIPSGQLCCGLPALIAGDRTGTRRLVQHNIAALAPQQFDWIITACTSCGRMLKEEYPLLVKSPNAKTLSQKVIDITEFVVKYLSNDIPLKSGGIRTTYHTPCHAIWGEINQSTRSLLNRISQYMETDPDGKCCGGGGSFSFKYESLARQIGAAKIETLCNPFSKRIKQARLPACRQTRPARQVNPLNQLTKTIPEPEVIATGCPGCMMQLNHLLKTSGINNISVRHPIEILAGKI